MAGSKSSRVAGELSENPNAVPWGGRSPVRRLLLEPAERATQTEPGPKKIAGLDSIRIVCAAVVMLYHIGLTDPLHSGSFHSLSNVVAAVINNLFDGPAAVIVFFVISGFCIHYPFRGQRRLSITPFLARRFIRIVLPALCFSLILWGALRARSNLQESVLWSVFCEAIYYLLYPGLLYLRRKSSWSALLGCSFFCASAWMLSHASQLHANSLLKLSTQPYVVFRWATWIVGLPAWLLGCWLAENFHLFTRLSRSAMWSARIAIYAASILIGVCRYRFESPMLSDCVLLDLFAVPVCFWIGFEIVYAARHAPPRSLEWGGRWSYSLYLAHPLVLPALSFLGLASVSESLAMHFALLAAALVSSYGFYLLFEGPSHRLAVGAARILEAKSSPGYEQASRLSSGADV